MTRSAKEVINEREAISTLKLPVDASLQDCMLARNLLVKKNMKRDMRQMLLDMQLTHMPTPEEIAAAPVGMDV